MPNMVTIPLMGIKNVAVALSLLAALGLAGCSSTGATMNQGNASAEASSQRSIDEILGSLNVDTADPKKLIEALDALPLAERPTDLIASVLPDGVQLQPGQADETFLPVASDDFYLSIAPYVSQTHPCNFHSLTTCVGEMQHASVELNISDAKTGEVVLAEQRTTADNGFVGVWLPRNGEYKVSIKSEQGTAEQIVTTGENDPTCLTTMQLA